MCLNQILFIKAQDQIWCMCQSLPFPLPRSLQTLTHLNITELKCSVVIQTQLTWAVTSVLHSFLGQDSLGLPLPCLDFPLFPHDLLIILHLCNLDNNSSLLHIGSLFCFLMMYSTINNSSSSSSPIFFLFFIPLQGISHSNI